MPLRVSLVKLKSWKTLTHFQMISCLVFSEIFETWNILEPFCFVSCSS